MPKGSRKPSPRKVAAKRKSQRQNFKQRQEHNPFNRITAKNLHHSVMGQTVKGNVKRPGHSISRGIEKRKESLLKEYQAIESNQSNTFIDKRFEKTLEKKLSQLNAKKINKGHKQIQSMLKKLTSQRLKGGKQARFNLDDDEMGNLYDNEAAAAMGNAGDNGTGRATTLTHAGTPIDATTFTHSNEAHDIDTLAEDDSTQYLYRGFSKRNVCNMIRRKGMSFEQIAECAGVSLNARQNKTKPELIKEQILRSRYKICKQQVETERVQDDTGLVDQKFKDASEWIFAHRANQNHKQQQQPMDQDGDGDGEDGGSPPPQQRAHPSDYKSRKRRELDFEYAQKLYEFEQDERSGVSDRSITDAQKAKRNLEVLVEMEEKRKRKEMGLPLDSEADDDDLDDLEGLQQTKQKVDTAETQDANMEKLEAMFERAQQGFEDDDDDDDVVAVADGDDDKTHAKESVSQHHRESGDKADGGNATTESANWEQILEQVAAAETGDEDEEDDEDEGGDGDGDNMDNDEQFGYAAEIESKYLPHKRRMIDSDAEDLSDVEYEFGAEPVGHGEKTVLQLAAEEERRQKRMQAQEIRKQQTAATEDFDADGDHAAAAAGQGTKRKRYSMEDDAVWDALALHEEQDLTGHGLQDVPFTLDVPDTVDEFDALLCDKSASQQITLLKRMRCANHVKLSDQNKHKMQRLYDFLLDYLRKLCVHYEPTKSNQRKIGDLQSDIGFLQYVDVVTRALFALSHDISDYAYSTHIKKLENIAMHVQKHYNVKDEKQYKLQQSENNNHSNSSNSEGVSFMPSGYALFYLKLVAHIFPAQNKANPVVSAVLLILCKCITEIPIHGPRDIACYQFCVTLILDIIQKENRYVPEVMHSLSNLLRAGFMSSAHFNKTPFDLLKETDDLFFTFHAHSNVWHNLQKCKNVELSAANLCLPIRWIFLKRNDEQILRTKKFQIQALFSMLTLLRKCHQIWQSLLAYSEIFAPFYQVLTQPEIKEKICGCNAAVKELYQQVVKCLKDGIHSQSLTRQPLQLIHRARSIASLEPEFDPDLKPSFLRMKVKNVAALEKKRKRVLKKAVKKQKKCVEREIRKDTQFLQGEKTKHRIDADNKRQAKWMHEYHHLTEQQRDTNSFQMVGKKLKKKLVKQGVIKGY